MYILYVSCSYWLSGTFNYKLGRDLKRGGNPTPDWMLLLHAGIRPTIKVTIRASEWGESQLQS